MDLAQLGTHVPTSPRIVVDANACSWNQHSVVKNWETKMLKDQITILSGDKTEKQKCWKDEITTLILHSGIVYLFSNIILAFCEQIPGTKMLCKLK